MKRPLEDGEHEHDDDDELEEGEERPCSTSAPASIEAPPPPPPLLLRLVVHHSTRQPSADLLPAHQTLALLHDTTTVGRDRSYEARIRLKTLEVSRTHATFYLDASTTTTSSSADASSDSSNGHWCIVDNASTHGTFIRSDGDADYTRLSEKGQSSMPYRLNHLDTIKIANQRFVAHLHSSGSCCHDCAIDESRSNLVPLTEDPVASTSTASTVQSSANTALHAAPMSEHAAKTFTKEQKRHSYKNEMKSLRRSLLSSSTNAGNGNDTVPSTDNDTASDSTPSETQAPRYLDRAKLRRSIYPHQHGLSDADPPAAGNYPSKRMKGASSSAGPSQPVEPSYGAGAALFEKMLQGGSVSRDDASTRANGLSKSLGSQHHAPQTSPNLGKVIEVRTMADKGAGIGSGSVRQGVEQHATVSSGSGSDWKRMAIQRRWSEANR